MPSRFFSTLRHSLAVTAAAVALAVACFFLFSWHYNVLPYDYHPDEPGKVAQILYNWRNFHHPLLMLETAQLLRQWLHWPPLTYPSLPDPNFEQYMQKLTELGRRVCAGYAAGAVVLLALTGGLLAGWRGGLAVGLCCGLLHPLVIFAHDFKEDTTLCFGLALFALTAVAFWQALVCRPQHHPPTAASARTPAPPSALKMCLLSIGMGLASGVASSGKYVGMATLPVALLLALAGPTGRRGWPALFWRPARALGVLIGWVAAFSLINWRIFSHWPRFLNGFFSELEHGLSEHYGLTTSLPNTLWLELLNQQLTRPVWLGVLCCLIFQLTSRWTSRPPMPSTTTPSPTETPAYPLAPGSWILPGLALLYLAMLLASPLFFSRYALPVFLFLHATAGLGLVTAAHAASQVWDPPAAHENLFFRSLAPRPAMTLTLAALLLLVIAVQLPLCLDNLRQIRQDSRLQFLAWVRAHMPPGSHILQDSYVGLPTGWLQLDGNRGRIQVSCPGIFAADRSTLSMLFPRRITHVAVCDLSYGRLFNPRIRPTPGTETLYQRRRNFYEQLFRTATLEWEYVPPRPTGGYVNPAIRLYRLSSPSPVRRTSQAGN